MLKKFIIGVCALLAIMVCVVLVFTFLGPKQPMPQGEINDISSLEQYFQEMVDADYPPSLSITVLKGGDTVYSKGFGYIDMEHTNETSVDTIYPWWSTTKLFTAAAVMQLVEDGKIELDEDIRIYLPHFTTYNKNGGVEVITVRQLLGHSSGLRRMMPEVIQWIHLAEEEGPSVTELFNKRLVEDFNILEFSPGEDKLYTNTAYIALGAIIEKVTDDTYEDYVIENVLVPLQMYDSSFVRTREHEERTAVGTNAFLNINTVLLKVFGHERVFEDFVSTITDGRIYFKSLYTDFSPSTSLSGTTEDLSMIGKMLLDKGMMDEIEILSEESVDAMFGDVELSELPETYSDNPRVLNGLGFKSWNLNGHIAYGHGGGGSGYGTMFAVVPEKDMVYVVVGSDTNIDRNLMLELLDNIEW